MFGIRSRIKIFRINTAKKKAEKHITAANLLRNFNVQKDIIKSNEYSSSLLRSSNKSYDYASKKVSKFVNMAKSGERGRVIKNEMMNEADKEEEKADKYKELVKRLKK